MITRFLFCHIIMLAAGMTMAADASPLSPASAEMDVLSILMQDRDAAAGDQADSAASSNDAAVDSSPAYGTAGSHRWLIGGMLGSDLGDEKMAYVSGGFEWFAIDDFSIGIQADLGWVGQDSGADAGLFGLGIMMRWHFLRYEDWTMYGELGIGLAYATEPVRPTGGRLNFTPQAGVGFSFDLSHDVRLLVGIGWYHISNARTTSTNFGVDALAVTGLVSIPF
ncbi:MAG: acyloxyacyl hydrolase [Phycisphaerales bacterium]|jgi:hypothetical protein|nr:acyloxyacyl hydrolase [Phycisphaerales bacterium]